MSQVLSWSKSEQNDPLDLAISDWRTGEPDFKAMTKATFRAEEKCDVLLLFPQHSWATLIVMS